MDTTIYNQDLPPEESREGWLLVRIHVPELNVYKCLQFPADRIIWDVKNQVLASLPKELKESFNYGLFCPPSNGKAGKFLDEERRLGDYPFNGPVGYLELKYKRRVYKMLNLDERQLKALHTRANLRRFIDCVNGGHLEKITKMCAKGLDPNFHCADTGETPLTIATGAKKPSKLLIALVNGGALLDYRTREGSTALHKAVERDSLEAVNTLLELGASPNYRDSKGLTPLYLSVVKRSDPKICENLLHDHAVLGTKDTQGWQEVHQACRNGLVQHLEHLLRYGADTDARNASGNTPLHVCAVNNQEACAKILLFRGSQTSAHNFANQTAYQVAVIAGNLELAEMIQNFRPEDVVPFRMPPRYNLRRRSGLGWGLSSMLFNQNHCESPPSPCPSEQPFSSASSSLSEGSSSHRSHEDDISLVTDKSLGDTSDIISDSSGVGTNSDSIVCPVDHINTKVVCVETYNSNLAGHLSIQPGDVIEIIGSTDCGFLEGYIVGTNQCGFIPINCVQEYNIKEKMDRDMITQNEEHQNMNNINNGQNKILNMLTRRLILSEPRTVILHKAKRGFGFILRGAKASSPLMELKPSDRCPALQYLDDVDPGGVADMAGLKPGDFLLAINGQDVRCASHEHVVELIRTSGALVTMTVVSQKDSDIDNSEQNGNGYFINNNNGNHFSSRQCVTLPRKIGGMVGKIIAPTPPRRDPNTTLSVGRARAKSMVAGLEGNDDKDDEDIISGTKSISTESVNHRNSSNSGVSTPTSQPRTASIKSRPTSGRITTAELEELFQRQQGEYRGNNKYSTMMITSRFQSGIDSGSSTPPISPQKGPLVYASVAEMKRKKTTKIGSVKGKPCAIPVVNANLKRNFHSTPDLATQIRSDYSINSWTGTIGIKGHRSQDDINALRRLHLPPPNHPPPPPPVGQVVKVAVQRKSEYESAITLQQKLKQKSGPQNMEVMSSFRPANNAKLYASPQGISKTVEYRSNNNSNNNNINSNETLNKNGTLIKTPTQSHKTGTNGNNLSNISNKNAPQHPITSPPIPDPDYSLSESDGEEENSIMLARNTKFNANNLGETQVQIVENSGTSNTSSESANSIPHSFSVDEIRNIRKKLKSSKSFPNNLLQQTTNPSTIEISTHNTLEVNMEECDNSSSGVSSDQEIAMNNLNDSAKKITQQPSKLNQNPKVKKILFVNSNEPIIDDEDDRSPSPPITGFQRHNSMTRKQAASIAMSRGVLQRPPVSLVQLPPPIENESENEISTVSKKINEIEITPTNEQNPDFIVLAPPPQFCDQIDNKVEQHRSVRIVGAVPKAINNCNNRLSTH